MAKSRKRNRRQQPSDLRRALRRQQREIIELRAGQDLEPYLTEDDYRNFAAGLDAAARGDAASALRHEVAGLVGVAQRIRSGRSLGWMDAAAPHVAAALTTPGAFEAALVECTRADAADLWQAMAEATPDHVRRQCLTLAARCRAA